MIYTILEATRARKGEGLVMLSVMLVNYDQGAKGNKGGSYYNATLLSYSVSMLHVMGGVTISM